MMDQLLYTGATSKNIADFSFPSTLQILYFIVHSLLLRHPIIDCLLSEYFISEYLFDLTYCSEIFVYLIL